MEKHFDLIAIGSGSGGLTVAEKAAQFGKKVIIIEANKMGATKADFDNTIAIHPTSAEELVTMKTPESTCTTEVHEIDGGNEWRQVC